MGAPTGMGIIGALGPQKGKITGSVLFFVRAYTRVLTIKPSIERQRRTVA